MQHIQLRTFKGCQSTVDFRDRLEDLGNREELDLDIEMVIVPSPESAEEMGLFGSPTFLTNGVEFQSERRGPAGFY